MMPLKVSSLHSPEWVRRMGYGLLGYVSEHRHQRSWLSYDFANNQPHVPHQNQQLNRVLLPNLAPMRSFFVKNVEPRHAMNYRSICSPANQVCSERFSKKSVNTTFSKIWHFPPGVASKTRRPSFSYASLAN